MIISRRLVCSDTSIEVQKRFIGLTVNSFDWLIGLTYCIVNVFLKILLLVTYSTFLYNCLLLIRNVFLMYITEKYILSFSCFFASTGFRCPHHHLGTDRPIVSFWGAFVQAPERVWLRPFVKSLSPYFPLHYTQPKSLSCSPVGALHPLSWASS